MKSRGNRPLAIHRGMALIAVLWLVAALSIVLLGVAQAVRTEVRLVGHARQTAQAAAIGDAAIHMALQQVIAAPEAPKSKMVNMDLVFAGVPVRVVIRPVTGLLDINRSPKELLQTAYRLLGGADAQSADMLAQTTVDTRSKRDRQGAQQGFGVPEDLLTVPGITYDLYVKLRNIITTDSDSGGKVNPYAAPYELLLVVADGNASQAAGFMAAREAAVSGLDTTRFSGGFIDSSTSSRIRLVAAVPLKDGTWLNRSVTVDLSGGEKEGLPWRTLHSERSLTQHP